MGLRKGGGVKKAVHLHIGHLSIYARLLLYYTKVEDLKKKKFDIKGFSI